MIRLTQCLSFWGHASRKSDNQTVLHNNTHGSWAILLQTVWHKLLTCCA